MDSKLVACQVDVNGMIADCLQTRFATIIRNCTLVSEALFYYQVKSKIKSLIKSDEHKLPIQSMTADADN